MSVLWGPLQAAWPAPSAGFHLALYWPSPALVRLPLAPLPLRPAGPRLPQAHKPSAWFLRPWKVRRGGRFAFAMTWPGQLDLIKR